MDDPYEFRPLPDASCHMRLLTLLGADEASAPVECKMRVVGLGSQQPGEQVPYEALSYTWGADVHDEPVRVDGRPLRVTRNLHHALARLRRHSSQPPRVLWVDAICINQGDDDEKNLQVCEMRHIYGRAAAVVAWLGESDPDLEAAMCFLQSPAAKSFEKLNVLDDYPLAGLAAAADRELDSVAAVRELTAAFLKGALDKVGFAAEHDFSSGGAAKTQLRLAVPGLAKLFRKDWFSRVWVVQEVLGARVDPVVLCGDAQASWKTTQAVALQLASDDKLKHAILPEGFLNMGVLSMTHGFPFHSLEHLLKATAERQATNPSDNVYALLGLVHRSEAITVDYRVPAALVCQRAMTTIFKTRQDLHWLAYACGAQHQQPEVPSWCVDFSNKTWLRDKLEDDWGVTAGPWPTRLPWETGASHGRYPPTYSHDEATGTLAVTGKVVGVISYSQAPSAGAGLDVFVNDAYQFLACALPKLKRRVGLNTVASRMAAGLLWRTIGRGELFDFLLRGDHGNNNKAPSAKSLLWSAASQGSTMFDNIGRHQDGGGGYASLEAHSQQLLQPKFLCLREPWAHEVSQHTPLALGAAEEALVTLAYKAASSCYVSTDTGYFGVSGHPVQRGDMLCILFGCKWPVVLRPRCAEQEEREGFSLVTIAYCDDIMHGEALVAAASDFTRERTFFLR